MNNRYIKYTEWLNKYVGPWCFHQAHIYISPHPYHSCNIISLKLDFCIFLPFLGGPCAPPPLPSCTYRVAGSYIIFILFSHVTFNSRDVKHWQAWTKMLILIFRGSAGGCYDTPLGRGGANSDLTGTNSNEQSKLLDLILPQ